MKPQQKRGACDEPQRLDAVTGLNQANSEHQPELVALRNAARSLLKMPVAFIGFIEDSTQRLLTVTVAPQGSRPVSRWTSRRCSPLGSAPFVSTRSWNRITW